MVTANPNSYFHSWSPDGKTILFTRPANGSLNIFAIPAEGGEEKALTTGTGTSDDPDFSRGRPAHLLQFRSRGRNADLPHAAGWIACGANDV